MTLVISWIKLDPTTSDKTIWTLADGKIMNDDTTLTLEGSKVLELHIRCKNMKGPPPRNIYYRSSIGFAYAGSTLTGFNTFATLSDVCNNLGGDQDKNNLPTQKDIAEKAKIILQKYTVSQDRKCEIILFGFCPKNQTPFITKISPRQINETVEYETIETNPNLDTLQCLLLGDRTKEVNKSILNIAKGYTPDQYQYWSIPTAVFYDILQRKLISTVGGGMQLAIVYKNEFQMNAITTPDKYDPSKATLTHKNFDIFDDIGIFVGECTFAIDAMDIGVRAYQG